MGQASKFVHIFRFTPIPRFNRLFFTATTSYKCNSKLKLDCVRTQVVLKVKKTLQQRGNLVFQSPLNLNVPPNSLRKNSRFSGSYLSSGSILGLSIASASVIAHAMDAGDALVDDPCNDLDSSEEEENVHHLWKLARKFWLPIFFFLTVLTNFDDPIMILFIKVTLFLLSTKPNPFSVYIFVDKLCLQSMRQDNRFFKVKSLYASKVEVQDYKLLCLAAVEVRDQKFTLVGILGTWWTLPHLPYREAFSFIRNRLGSILVKTTEHSNLLF